eukprot:scaffold212303_cov17-Tisochrysis_lutea.AAC.1
MKGWVTPVKPLFYNTWLSTICLNSSCRESPRRPAPVNGGGGAFDEKDDEGDEGGPGEDSGERQRLSRAVEAN